MMIKSAIAALCMIVFAENVEAQNKTAQRKKTKGKAGGAHQKSWKDWKGQMASVRYGDKDDT